MVFGEVINGQDVVRVIENEYVDTKHKPYSSVLIARCGELVLTKIKKKKNIKSKSVFYLFYFFFNF